MTTLNDHRFVYMTTTISAARLNMMLDATVRGELSNTESLAANRTLTDADFALQVLTPTAARDVTLPAVSGANHPYYIANASSSYDLTIKDHSGTAVQTISAGETAFFLPNGIGWFVFGAGAAGGSGDVVGPASATNGAIALFNTTTGKLIKDSGLVPTATPAAGASPLASAAGKLDSWISSAAATVLGLVKLTNQLGGTASAPTVTGMTETSGPTALALGAVADGEYLKRVGSTVVGSTVTSGGANLAEIMAMIG